MDGAGSEPWGASVCCVGLCQSGGGGSELQWDVRAVCGAVASRHGLSMSTTLHECGPARADALGRACKAWVGGLLCQGESRADALRHVARHGARVLVRKPMTLAAGLSTGCSAAVPAGPYVPGEHGDPVHAEDPADVIGPRTLPGT